MRKGDVVLLDVEEFARAQVPPGSLAAAITIHYASLCNSLGMVTLSFYVNSVEEDGHKYSILKQNIHDFLTAYASDGTAKSYQMTGCFYLLVSTLATYFTEPAKQESESGDEAIASFMYAPRT